MEGRALAEAIENALRAVFGEKNGFNMVSLHDGSPLGDSSPSHCACVILRHYRLLSTAKPRAHASQRQIRFQSWRKATTASFFLIHDHLFKNKEDVVTVDKTDEVEDQKVSPQFRFIC